LGFARVYSLSAELMSDYIMKGKRFEK